MCASTYSKIIITLQWFKIWRLFNSNCFIFFKRFFFWLVKFQFLNKNTSADECFWDFFFKFNDPSSYSLSMFYVLLAGCFECF